MALTLIERVGPILTRGACFAICVLALMIVYVFGDIWRIERRTGRPISAICIAILAAACLAIGALFGRCALTGCYPQPPIDTGGCQ